jgi:dihydrofolate reductase
MKKFNVIIATDINGGFGLNNTIPWKFKIDTNFFKSITTSHTILPGLNGFSKGLIERVKNTY